MTRARKSVIRQGNVLLIPVNNTKICGNKLFRLILATEEVTGYYFCISKGQGEFYERDGFLYLQVISPQATLKYEGQKVLEIPQGYWMIHVIQRDYFLLSCLHIISRSPLISNSCFLKTS
jgi:hypothetical protein